ncbi:uncharacterized protein [Anabrus simplex]|uniref:uncharacterized protein n=1 Tax=Anabrus simplex TaxID=316456 RepID=UPI0035A30128
MRSSTIAQIVINGEGRASSSSRTSPGPGGDKNNKMPTAAAVPRMRTADDQSGASKLKLPGPPPTLMMEWASVASWFFRPDSSPLTCTSTNTNTTTTTGSTRTTNTSGSNSDRQFSLAPTICTAIRCTVPSCSCECFTPGKMNIRYCDTCSHSWVPHGK